MKTAIVTLLLGRPYWLAWHEVCAPSWRAYAERHGYDIIAIDRPLDVSPRAMARSPAWQKCLVLQPSIAGEYDRIVWLDADIVIKPEGACRYDRSPDRENRSGRRVRFSKPRCPSGILAPNGRGDEGPQSRAGTDLAIISRSAGLSRVLGTPPARKTHRADRRSGALASSSPRHPGARVLQV